MAGVFSYENEVFSSFMFYSMLLILKLFFMSFYTVFYRMANKAFANAEDRSFAWEGKIPKVPVTLSDQDVERVRRNHLNDIENILPFILVGLFYVTTIPSTFVAVWHFRIFTLARFMHFICYQKALPQPSRGLCFGVGMLATMSMLIQNIMTTL